MLSLFSYVGQFYVKANGIPVDILAKMNRLAGFAPGEDIELFEVNPLLLTLLLEILVMGSHFCTNVYYIDASFLVFIPVNLQHKYAILHT